MQDQPTGERAGRTDRLDRTDYVDWSQRLDGSTAMKQRGLKTRKNGSALSASRLRVPRAGLHEQAAARLRMLIVRGDLAPGEPLDGS